MAKRTPLPDESKPGYYHKTDTGKKVAESLTDPKIPTAGKQTYTTQQEQAGEILSNVAMGAPTTVGGRTVTAPTLGSVTPATTSTIAQPGQVQAGTYGANVAGTAAQAAGQQATGLTQQVVGQAGTALQATAATDSTAMTGALAGNVIGSLSPASIVSAVTGTTPDEALMSKQVE